MIAAHDRFTCPHCEAGVIGAVIAQTCEEGFTYVQWIRCPACHLGVVKNTGAVAPSALVGEKVEGLPQDVEAAYLEARRCAGVDAFTSCELMCRKILMHIAVDKGDVGGRTFAQYLDYLEKSGYTTPAMSPWVDLIRKNGNISTHDIPAADRDRAFGTLAFTAQLLKIVYEMNFKVNQFMPAPAPAPATPPATP